MTVFHSAAWPEGAAFFSTLLRIWDNRTHDARQQLITNASFSTTTTGTITGTLHNSCALAPTLDHLSNHGLLSAQAFLQHAPSTWELLVRQANALPGMSAHGLALHIDIATFPPGHRHHDPRVLYPALIGLVGRVTSIHNGDIHRYVRASHERPLTHQLHDLFDTLDRLNACAPDPDAPLWVALHHPPSLQPPNGALTLYPLITPPFRANSTEDAKTLAPLLANKGTIPPEDIAVFCHSGTDRVRAKGPIVWTNP